VSFPELDDLLVEPLHTYGVFELVGDVPGGSVIVIDSHPRRAIRESRVGGRVPL
jgi:hypothetical protein